MPYEILDTYIEKYMSLLSDTKTAVGSKVNPLFDYCVPKTREGNGYILHRTNIESANYFKIPFEKHGDFRVICHMATAPIIGMDLDVFDYVAYAYEIRTYQVYKDNNGDIVVRSL